MSSSPGVFFVSLLSLIYLCSASVHMNLRMLVLTSPLSTDVSLNDGADVALLAFDSVGMPYDVVEVSETTILDLITTTGSGKYSGFVSSTKDILSLAQQQQIVSYQKQFGVKWVVMRSSPEGLPGVTVGSAIYTRGNLALSPEFYTYSHPLKTTATIDTMHSVAWANLEPATLVPAVIVDHSIVIPALVFNGDKVAAAQFKFPDGTYQLHYFITQSEDYFHSRVFSVVLLNWLAPAGLFMGYRYLSLAVQPDDLFLASFLWDDVNHVNSLSTSLTYRLTADDLQATADFLTYINGILPAGSHVTIEWPFNGAGTTWYSQPDPLFAKAVALQDKFYFVSHTWDHPCTFDTATYADVFGELYNNTLFTPRFLTGGLDSPVFTKDAVVSPCITGLFNGEALRAMADIGIKYTVGDNSVPSLVPENLYHGVSYFSAIHGHDGIFIIPREAYDLDYDDSLPQEWVDQYNTENMVNNTFEEIMQLNVDYAMAKKTAFRHDAFMFHQANLRMFPYTDPFGAVRNAPTASLTTLWMERLLQQLAAIYDLPVVSPKFDQLAKLWMDREAMDKCGFNADLEINASQLVGITATSTQSCEVPLSGLPLASGTNIRVQQLGPQTTAFLTMTANQPLHLTLSSPVPI